MKQRQQNGAPVLQPRLRVVQPDGVVIGGADQQVGGAVEGDGVDAGSGVLALRKKQGQEAAAVAAAAAAAAAKQGRAIARRWLTVAPIVTTDCMPGAGAPALAAARCGNSAVAAADAPSAAHHGLQTASPGA